ncbi:MAG: NAD(P)H-dependent oxidoreductase [Cyanobacteria bacterium]|nr:NAD(P)H-dependent oxidoreductase [Cyanobacteriota bacterium]
MVDVLGLSNSMTPTLTPSCDVLVIAASNGQNLLLAERFAAAARELGQGAEVLDLTAISLPLFTPRAQAAGTPAALAALQARLVAVPCWVICTPEYNGSIPPVLTSAIAWLSMQGDDFRTLFNGRPVAIATHSGGGGHTVLTALRLQLAHLGANVVGRQLVSNKTQPAKDDSIADLISRLNHLRA